MVQAVATRRANTVCISGLTGEGLPDLLDRVSNKLQDSMVAVHCLIPYSQGELVDEIHRTGVVSSAEFGATGTEVRAHVPLALAQRLQPLRLATAAVAAAAAAAAAGGGSSGGQESEEEEEWGEELAQEDGAEAEAEGSEQRLAAERAQR